MDNVEFVKSILLFALGCAVIAFTLIKFDDASVSAWKIGLAFTFAASLFLISNISKDEVSEFKFGTLYVKLDNKIKEADETLQKLRQLTLLIMKPVSLIVSATNNTAEQRSAYVQKMKETLTEMGIDQKSVDEILEDYHKFTVTQIISQASKPIKGIIIEARNENNCSAINTQNQQACEDLAKHLNEITDTLAHLIRDIHRHTHNALDGYKLVSAIVDEIHSLSTEQKEKIKNSEEIKMLKHYCEYKEFDPQTPKWRPISPE